MPSQRETRYAVSGDVSIAYQVVSDGPFDVVWVPGAVSNVELLWENEAAARFYSRVASFCRLILFDKRGTGLSDRVSGIADLETRMDDVRAVMDAAGIERAAIVGASEGGPMSVLFAATYPERTRALVVYGSGPRFTRAPGFPFGPTREETVTTNDRDQRLWGTVELAREYLGADAPSDEVDRFASRMRQSASPGAVRQLDRMNLDIDVRGVLPSIRVPTLVLHRTEDHVPCRGREVDGGTDPGRALRRAPGRAAHVVATATGSASSTRSPDSSSRSAPGRTKQRSPSACSPPSCSRTSSARRRRQRSSATAVGGSCSSGITRSSGSCSRASAAPRSTRPATASSRAFDGPRARSGVRVRSARRCADWGSTCARGCTRASARSSTTRSRGSPCNIGARVAAEAGPGEVLVSQTVKDLVAGSGILFEDRGSAELNFAGGGTTTAPRATRIASNCSSTGATDGRLHLEHGEYTFQCDPHALLGMKGTFDVGGVGQV